jgi:hypothetical protein
MVKLILYIAKCVLIILGLLTIYDARYKEGKMAARSQSGMAELVIDSTTNGYFTILDDYECSFGIELQLTDRSKYDLLRKNKIRLYVQGSDGWDQLEVRKDSRTPFYISRGASCDKNEYPQLIKVKYEAELKDGSSDLIHITPSRIYCGMEFMYLGLLGLSGCGLIIIVITVECVWLVVSLIRKKYYLSSEREY